jgi:hypothetical protein
MAADDFSSTSSAFGDYQLAVAAYRASILRCQVADAELEACKAILRRTSAALAKERPIAESVPQHRTV